MPWKRWEGTKVEALAKDECRILREENPSLQQADLVAIVDAAMDEAVNSADGWLKVKIRQQARDAHRREAARRAAAIEQAGLPKKARQVTRRELQRLKRLGHAAQRFKEHALAHRLRLPTLRLGRSTVPYQQIAKYAADGKAKGISERELIRFISNQMLLLGQQELDDSTLRRARGRLRREGRWPLYR